MITYVKSVAGTTAAAAGSRGPPLLQQPFRLSAMITSHRRLRAGFILLLITSFVAADANPTADTRKRFARSPVRNATFTVLFIPGMINYKLCTVPAISGTLDLVFLSVFFFLMKKVCFLPG